MGTISLQPCLVKAFNDFLAICERIPNNALNKTQYTALFSIFHGKKWRTHSHYNYDLWQYFITCRKIMKTSTKKSSP